MTDDNDRMNAYVQKFEEELDGETIDVIINVIAYLLYDVYEGLNISIFKFIDMFQKVFYEVIDNNGGTT